MTNKQRKEVPDLEPLTLIFTQDLSNPDLFECDDGTVYTLDEMNALKETENQKIKKFLVTAPAGKQIINCYK